MYTVYVHIYSSIHNILEKCVSSTLSAAQHLPLCKRMDAFCFQGCLCVQEMYSQIISTRPEFARSRRADLQIEAGALRHGGEGRDGRHRGEGTHQHKDTPAVELVGRAHLETPA